MTTGLLSHWQAMAEEEDKLAIFAKVHTITT